MWKNRINIIIFQLMPNPNGCPATVGPNVTTYAHRRRGAL